MDFSPLRVLYEDEYLIAIDKPAGLLVHRTRLAAEETQYFALQILRDQLGQAVFPVHRLDRPTSGVLLFSKEKHVLPLLKEAFSNRTVQKVYWAIVRGIPDPATGTYDRSLLHPIHGKLQEAQTSYAVLASAETPWNSTGRYPTSRYAWLELRPITGRTHQLRRHLAQARHYILGDKKHGDNRQNNYMEKHFGNDRLLLHAHKLTLVHPIHQENLEFIAPPPPYFLKILGDIGINFQEVINKT